MLGGNEQESYSDAELDAEFAALFPQGFGGSDVLRELAPEGWDASPLVAVNHPTLAQVYEESVQFHRNLISLRRPDDPQPAPSEPVMEEISRDFRTTPVESEREARELVGRCLWDVFSDGHDVVAADGRRLDLGSFRGSGGFLADVLNRQIGIVEYDYLDFYMGTIWISGRADLTPVYGLIFRRLQARGLDWVYHFPRLYAVDLRPLSEAMNHQGEPEWANYDPSTSLAEEADRKDRDEQLAELRESLDEGYREAVEAARNQPPPATVQAYIAIYGRCPRGWPPAESS